MISTQQFYMFSYRFDAIRVVAGKLRVERRLHGLVDNSVYNSEGVEVETNTFGSAIGNLLVLLHEMIIELVLLEVSHGSLVMPPYLQLARSDYIIVSIADHSEDCRNVW